MLSLALIVNVLRFAYSTQLLNDAECIRENINKIIKLYPEGVPELNISSFKEFRPADLELIDTPRVGGLWITMQLRNQVTAGMENATVRQVSGFQRDPNKSKIDITVHVPRLTYRSSYAMELRWLTLVQTNTTGACYAEFQDVNLSLNLKVIVRYQQQWRYLTAYQLTPQLLLGRFVLQLDNLYKDNLDLTLAVNRAYNEHRHELWNDIESTVLTSYTKAAAVLLNRIFSTISYDDMFM